MIAVAPLSVSVAGTDASAPAAPAAQLQAGAVPAFGQALADAGQPAGLDLQALLAGLPQPAQEPADTAAESAPIDIPLPADPKHAAARSLVAALFRTAEAADGSEETPAGAEGVDALAALAGTGLEAVFARALPSAAAPTAVQPQPSTALPVAMQPGTSAPAVSSPSAVAPAAASAAVIQSASPVQAASLQSGTDLADSPATPARVAAPVGELLQPAAASPASQSTAQHAITALRSENVTTTPSADSGLLAMLGQRIQVQSQQGVQQAVVRLEPYMAGTVQVEIRHEAGVLRIHLTASNDDVVRQLQSVGEGLRQELGSRQFTDVSVQVGQQRHTAGDGGQGRHGREDGGASEQRTPGRALGDSDDAYAAFASVLRRMNEGGH